MKPKQFSDYVLNTLQAKFGEDNVIEELQHVLLKCDATSEMVSADKTRINVAYHSSRSIKGFGDVIWTVE